MTPLLSKDELDARLKAYTRLRQAYEAYATKRATLTQNGPKPGDPHVMKAVADHWDTVRGWALESFEQDIKDAETDVLALQDKA